MTSTAGPKRKKGASKKNKKSWRKNTDIDDVNEFLDDQRLEERLGGPFDEKKDDELFVVDKGHEDESPAPALTRRAARKKAAAEKPLRCNQVLLPEVEDKPHKTPGQKPNPVRVAKQKALNEKGIFKAKERLAKKHKILADKARESTILDRSTRRRTKFDFDLWDEKDEGSQVEAVKSNAWLDESTKTHTLRGMKKKGVKVPKTNKTTSLPAVEPPLAGESYNPSFKDHQDLLYTATMAELDKEKAQRKLDRHTTDMFPEKPPTQKEQLQEMAEGLFEAPADDVTAAVDDESEEEEKKGNKLKTKKQKRKEKARKFREMKADRRKKAKLASDNDFSRLKSIKKQVNAEYRAALDAKAKKDQKKADRLLKPSVLSGCKFEEKDLDLKLSEELTGNLRSLKPEGSILADRFHSLQKRNMIETRVKQKVKRKSKNRKIVERRTHKMGFDWE